MTNSAGARLNNEPEQTGIVGTWALQVSSPFGVQPITFTVERIGGTLTGTMRHERGAAAVNSIQVRGSEFDATAEITLKGTRITAAINGRIAGTQMNGTVKVHLPLAPVVKFIGARTA